MTMTPDEKRTLIDEAREAHEEAMSSAEYEDWEHVGCTVPKLLDALEATPDTTDENARDVAYKIARLGAEHMPILAWGGGAVPEPMGEVCSKCGDGECTLGAELDAIIPELARAVPETETEWEYSVGNRHPRGHYSADADMDDDELCTSVIEVRERVAEALESGSYDNAIPLRRRVYTWEPLPERGEG